MFRYDASSKVSESSFNEFVGDIPTKHTDRFSVLARFGKHKVALIADISKAFFICGSQEDSDALRLLWVDNPILSHPQIRELRFTSFCFGVISSM